MKSLAGWLPALNCTSRADDITAAIMREVDEYAQPGNDAAARGVRRMAHDAVAGFAARVTRPAAAAAAEPPEAASAAGMFHDLGRLLAMEGRSISALHAALRIGARVTWRSLQEQARQGNGNPEAFAHIGETVFWYMDELAASCSAGYAEARAELAGETSQLRRRLLDMLTTSPAPPAPAIASLAQGGLPRPLATPWWPPSRSPPLAGSSPVPAASTNVLADLTRRDPRLLIADPDGPGRRGQLATALTRLADGGGPVITGHPSAVHHLLAASLVSQLAAVGPAVPLTGASGSLRWAWPVRSPLPARVPGPGSARAEVTLASRATAPRARRGSSGARTTCPRSSCWPTLTWR